MMQPQIIQQGPRPSGPPQQGGAGRGGMPPQGMMPPPPGMMPPPPGMGGMPPPQGMMPPRMPPQQPPQ